MLKAYCVHCGNPLNTAGGCLYCEPGIRENGQIFTCTHEMPYPHYLYVPALDTEYREKLLVKHLKRAISTLRTASNSKTLKRRADALQGILRHLCIK